MNFKRSGPLAVSYLLLFIFIVRCATTGYHWNGLRAHNRVRRVHRSPAMRLEHNLSHNAQRCAVYYASKQTIDVSCGTNGAANLYTARGGGRSEKNLTLQNAVTSAVASWYDEHHNYNYSYPGASQEITRYFTQLVWKNSTLLGIGAATVNGYTAVVALYSPPGNVMFRGRGDLWRFYKRNVESPR